MSFYVLLAIFRQERSEQQTFIPIYVHIMWQLLILVRYPVHQHLNAAESYPLQWVSFSLRSTIEEKPLSR